MAFQMQASRRDAVDVREPSPDERDETVHLKKNAGVQKLRNGAADFGLVIGCQLFTIPLREFPRGDLDFRVRVLA
jgi:hypothetical protein